MSLLIRNRSLINIKNYLLFGSLAGATKWVGGVLAPNGKIYGIPFDSTTVLEIFNLGIQDAADNNIPALNLLASSAYNRFHNKY